MKIDSTASLRPEACFQEIHCSRVPQCQCQQGVAFPCCVCILILFCKHCMESLPSGDKESQASESKCKGYFRKTFPIAPQSPHVFGTNPAFSEDTPPVFHASGPLQTKRIREKAWADSFKYNTSRPRLPTVHFIDPFRSLPNIISIPFNILWA